MKLEDSKRKMTSKQARKMDWEIRIIASSKSSIKTTQPNI
jgi:hypothetical protein